MEMNAKLKGITAYRQRGVSSNLQEVLDKLQGKVPKPHTPVNYSASDILKAKAVLDRLLDNSSRNVVTTIKVVPIEVNER
jgi:hypothetical protein